MRLRRLGPGDEQAFLVACHSMESRFTFGLSHRDGMPWSDYLTLLENEHLGRDLPAGRVPATFLVAEADGEIIGRVSIRHSLNAKLTREGGHIGYGVVPAHRRRGHATEILRQSLVIARSHGIDRVLITCDDTNLVSAKVIETNGGVLQDVLDGVRRYWVD